MGTSPFFLCVVVYLRDHPHACGDKFLSVKFPITGIGSSPRVWGQVILDEIECTIIWIIPTRVGTSCCHCISIYTIRDHPHACGDKFSIAVIQNDNVGSSPRVWGQDVRFRFAPRRDRIIPTRVGTSS